MPFQPNGEFIIIPIIKKIGLNLKKKLPNLKWIADFRDPWTEWGALKEFRISDPIMKLHKYLEKKVLHCADEILTISPFYVKKFQKLTTRPVRLITNGYDASDFLSFKISTILFSVIMASLI